MLEVTEDSTEFSTEGKIMISVTAGIARVLLLITLILASIPALVILPLKLTKEIIAVTVFVVRRLIQKMRGTAEPLQYYC